MGMEDEKRFTTQWGPNGKTHVPPQFWLEYVNCCPQRRKDMWDILVASALRDAEYHDSNFSSYYWNMTQSVTREKHRSACCGVAGCVTPGGDFFIPSCGRPIL